MTAPHTTDKVGEALARKRDRVHPSNRRADLPMIVKITFGDLETILAALASSRAEGEGNPHPEQVEAARMQAFVDAAPDQRERIRRTFEQVAFEHGIRPIDPPRLSGFTADVAVEAAERLLASLANRPADDGERKHCDLPCGYDCGHPDGCLVSPPQPEGVKRP